MRIGWGMLALLGAAVGGCTGPNDCAAASWEPCDIRDAACQRTVLAAVQCDRGHVLDTVPSVRIITPEALRLELDQAPTTSSPVRDAAYQTLGLIPRTGGLRDAEIDALVANLLASYSSERQQITIIDRGAAMSSADASATFAHELVHAMQDALYDLDAYQAAVHTSDEREARRTVVEGEAQFFQILYQIRQLQHRPEEAPWDQFYASWREAVLTQIGTSDAPLVATRNAYPYLAGAEQLTGEWRAQPRGSVASAWFEMPPTATIDVMRSRGRGAPLTCAPTPPPNGYSAVDDDALGVLAVIAMVDRARGSPVQPPMVDPAVALDVERVVETFVGDRFETFSRDGHTAFVWRIHSDDAPGLGAAQALGDWGRMPGHFVRALSDTELVLLGGSDAVAVEAWAGMVRSCR